MLKPREVETAEKVAYNSSLRARDTQPSGGEGGVGKVWVAKKHVAACAQARR